MNRGFTLIEVVVAAGVFITVVVVISGTMITNLRAQQTILSEGRIISQLSYAMEYMSRNLRMARKDAVTKDCSDIPDKDNYAITGGGSGIRFIGQEGKCRHFYINGENLFEEIGDTDTDTDRLTSPQVSVTQFSVTVEGEEQPDSDLRQPRVTLTLHVQPEEGGEEIPLQTTISQRNLDVKR